MGCRFGADRVLTGTDGVPEQVQHRWVAGKVTVEVKYTNTETVLVQYRWDSRAPREPVERSRLALPAPEDAKGAKAKASKGSKGIMQKAGRIDLLEAPAAQSFRCSLGQD